MKDRLKYVIDSRYFDGTCLTSMSDGFHNDYGGETIEELRIRENNPYLKAVTPSDIDKKLRLYNQSLSEPFKEITEEDYYDLLDVLPPLRMRQNSFFVGEPYYGNMYSFCFTRQGRYFKGLRSVLTPQSELDSQIDRHMEIINRKAVISKEETSKTISGTRLIPYYFSLDGKQSVFICNLVIQSDSRQARTDMANTLKSRKRLLNYILCIRFFIEVHSIVSASRFFHMPTYLRVVIECQSRFFPFFPAFSRNCPDYFLHTSGSSSFRSLSDLGAR